MKSLKHITLQVNVSRIDTAKVLDDALAEEKVLFEGAQGVVFRP